MGAGGSVHSSVPASSGGGDATRCVAVLSAAGLQDSDWIGGTSDPFCIVRVGAAGTSWGEKGLSAGGRQWRSRTIDNTSNPRWDLAFNVGSGTADEVHIRVLDKDVIGSDFLGEARSLLQWDGEEHALEISLECVAAGAQLKLACWGATEASPSPLWSASPPAWGAALGQTAAVVNGRQEGGEGDNSFATFVQGILDSAEVKEQAAAEAFASKAQSVRDAWPSATSRNEGVFAASQDAVWANFTDYAAFFTATGYAASLVEAAPSGAPNGVGALRSVKTENGRMEFLERITAFEPKQGFSYRIEKLTGVVGSALGKVMEHVGGELTFAAVPEESGGGTRVVWTSTVKMPFAWMAQTVAASLEERIFPVFLAQASARLGAKEAAASG